MLERAAIIAGEKRGRRQSGGRKRWAPASAATLLCAIAVAVLATPGDARAARVVSVHDEGHLRFVSGAGSALIDEGAASGTLPGRVRLQFSYSGGSIVSAQFTVRGSGWSIRAAGRVTLSNATSPSPSFRGSLRILGGTGRYAHATGSGELFGVFYRRSYALTVQAIGKLTY
jgi:hypothetical protein